jgi:hypothetical protein
VRHVELPADAPVLAIPPAEVIERAAGRADPDWVRTLETARLDHERRLDQLERRQ